MDCKVCKKPLDYKTDLPNIKIGDNTKIGAGSVVLNDIPKDSTAVGVTAKVINI